MNKRKIIDFSITKEITVDKSVIYIADKSTKFDKFSFSKNELEYIKYKLEAGDKYLTINSYFKWTYIQIVDEEKEGVKLLEFIRKAGAKLQANIKENHHTSIIVVDAIGKPELTLAFCEGLALANYQFLKYQKITKDKLSKLEDIQIYSSKLKNSDINQLVTLIEAVYYTRDLVNEPLSFLTAVQLSKEIKKMGNEAGFTVEVFEKKKIEALKMAGIMAVNKGSKEPPTFSILEWKPANATNKKPLILVGKGIVFDTGGVNIKTGANMDYMKCDMAGAAAVAGTFYAIAKAQLAVHVIGLIPATDNFPDGAAYVPGDIIKMNNGVHVEVISTDAEGRLILADALDYAANYKPELVIDLATLTGNASQAIGKIGMVAMGTANEKTMLQLKQSGFNVHERIVEFPLWDEYGDMIKSETADIKNIGGSHAGAITAGKFLEHFTSYPWIHLDIAGPAFIEKKDGYRTYGGTAVGVRLLFDFISKYEKK